MFKFIKNYLEKKEIRSKLEDELYNLLKYDLEFPGAILCKIGKLSDNVLIKSIKSLKNLKESIISIPKKDLVLFPECNNLLDILKINLDKLKENISIDFESRKYLLDILEKYIQGEINIIPELNGKYNRLFLEEFLNTVEIVRIVKKYPKEVTKNNIKFLEENEYILESFYQKLQDFQKEYIKQYLQEKNIEKKLIERPEYIDYKNFNIPTNKISRYSKLYLDEKYIGESNSLEEITLQDIFIIEKSYK